MDSENNVYTVLLVVAAIALVAAVIFVAMKGMSLYGSPFSLPTAMLGDVREMLAATTGLA
ncbi:hypothetical protein [Poriferisphaera sp. WC338]|uniref:hypothetical protein n=1 Tax=Poriferisphaera sp. WC338 TaxID=3425129 RepID=UPI003D8198B0